MLSASRITVGTTPTLLCDPGTNLSEMDVRWVEIDNDTGVSIFLGGSAVSTASGRTVVDGASWSGTLGANDKLYAVVASGTESVSVFKSRQ